MSRKLQVGDWVRRTDTEVVALYRVESYNVGSWQSLGGVVVRVIVRDAPQPRKVDADVYRDNDLREKWAVRVAKTGSLLGIRANGASFIEAVTRLKAKLEAGR